MRVFGTRVFLLATAASLAAGDAAAQYTYAPSQDYYRNDTAQGTVVGGGLGAITGALIGGGKGKGGEGALIGAGIGAIQQRGARLDLSPQGLIQLKQAGVSDAVLIAAQRSSGAPASTYVAPYAPAPPTVVIDRRPMYYYEPPPPSVYFSFGGHGHHHHHGHCW